MPGTTSALRLCLWAIPPILASAAQYRAPGPYFPSVLDPDTKGKTFQSIASKIKGFAKQHKTINSKEAFGNLAFLTLNCYTDSDLLAHKQKDLILDLIDTHHPSVVGLQNVDDSVIKFLENGTDKHYGVTADKYGYKEVRKGSTTFKPIFYDQSILEVVNQGGFEPKDKHNENYATFATFRIKNAKTAGTNKVENIFSVINGDIFSVDPGTADAQFNNMLSHFVSDPAVSAGPLIFLGSINALSDTMKLIVNQTTNVIEKDHHNNVKSKTTFHSFGKYMDGIEKDFILHLDKKQHLTLNYARILSSFNNTVFEHYPLFAIMEFNKSSSLK